MLLRDQIEARHEELKELSRESDSPGQEMTRFASSLADLYTRLDAQTKSARLLPDTDKGFYRQFALRVEVLSEVGEVLGCCDDLNVFGMGGPSSDHPDDRAQCIHVGINHIHDVIIGRTD